MSRNQKGHGKPAKGASDGRRVQRVEKEIREVIGQYLIRGFRGELPGIVSVSRVIASKDLRTAKVLVTLLVPATVASPNEEDEKKTRVAHDQTVDVLQAHAHQFQDEVNRCLKMKHCPRITFLYDDGFEHALRVESILRDLKIKSGHASPDQGGDESDDDFSDDFEDED